VVGSRTLILGWEEGGDPDPDDMFYYSVFLSSSLESLYDGKWPPGSRRTPWK
jgi:hypothetical protein